MFVRACGAWAVQCLCSAAWSLNGRQIRFGDYTDEYYRTSFLADGLHTLVPAHLLHNQLRTTEWQRRESTTPTPTPTLT
jgi:hypothetical protein